MKEELTIVKVGGAVVEDEAQLAQLLKDFSAIEGRKVRYLCMVEAEGLHRWPLNLALSRKW